MKEWLKQDKLDLLTKWSSNGLSYKDIADNMGINRSTLWEWRKSNKDISDAIKKGREIAHEIVENKLFQKTIGYHYDEDTYELRDGKLTLVKKVTKYQHPDLGSIVFYLKNMLPNKWKDKIDNESVDVLEKLDELLKAQGK